MEAWRGDGVGSCIEVNVVMAIVAVIRVAVVVVVSYCIVVARRTSQLLMSLLKDVPQLLSVILASATAPKRKLISATRDTCKTRTEQGVRDRGLC